MGETLFIDARNYGQMISRVHNTLKDDEIFHIASIYKAWRGDKQSNSYFDIPGLAKSSNIEEIAKHKYALVPGRYVGFSDNQPSGDLSALQEEFESLKAKLNQSYSSASFAIQTLEQLING